MAISERSTEERLRERLRELRRGRGMSLAEVAAQAGMDASTLSRLETGARRIAVGHLGPLAAALGVSVEELLAPPRTGDPRVRRRPRTVDGMTVWPLTRSAPPSGLRAFKLAIPADRVEPRQRTHEGHEWLYVLAGRVRLLLGEEEFLLAPGEAAEFSTWTPHWIGAHGGPAEVLAIFGPHGERVHLRARREAVGEGR
jgi:transcriptional regulator with XRE-family HTH domain